MTVLLAHGGPAGLELGVVVLPMLILLGFAVWNRQRDADEPSGEPEADLDAPT